MTSALPPVTPERIQIAKDNGLVHVNAMARACREAQVPFYVACALFEKESGGHNVYGHDAGGTMYGAGQVTKANFAEFYKLVVDQGHMSNGVGPAQITWRGFFPDMVKKGLKPWKPHDNMLYGLQLLHDYRIVNGGESWEVCGERYNGEKSYGIDFAAKVAQWKQRLGV